MGMAGVTSDQPRVGDGQDERTRERISRGQKGHAGRHGNREATESWENGAVLTPCAASPVRLGAC